MNLRRAHLVQNTLKKIDEGVNNTHSCAVRLDGETVRAYVKPLPFSKLIVECFCSLLLKHWGLNVPEPILVEIDGADWFGAVDAEYPSLYRRFFQDSRNTPGWEERLKRAMEIAANLPDTPRAIACDEAIANHDRNLGNILWNGQHTAWIDHENAIDIPRKDKNINKLVKMAVATGDFIDIEHAAIEVARSLGRGALDEIVQAIQDSGGCARLVAHHLKTLPQRIIQRFPEPENDLFGT